MRLRTFVICGLGLLVFGCCCVRCGPSVPGDRSMAYVNEEGNIAIVDFRTSILDLRGERITVITDNSFNTDPSWSNDGSSIAYIHMYREVWKYEIATEVNELLFSSEDGCPTPEGLIRSIEWAQGDSGIFHHCSINPALSGLYLTPIVPGSAHGSRRIMASVDFDVSPDGDSILYTRSTQAGETPEGFGLYAYDCQTDNTHTIVWPQARRMVGPRLSPTEWVAAFYLLPQDRSGTAKVATVDVTTGRIHEITDYTPTVRGPYYGSCRPTLDWSSRGTTLAYESDGNIWFYDYVRGQELYQFGPGCNPAWRPVD